MAPNDFHYLVTTHPSLLEFMQADKGSGIICLNQGDDDRVWISPSARRILSIPYDAYPDKAGLSERVHHRDAEAWEQVMDVNQVNIFDQQGAVIHIKQVAGKYRAFSIKRKVLRDNHQEPYCLLIVIHDLAEVIIEPEPTREHSHQDIGFWEMNENYQVVRCTPEWLDMVGISFDREGVFCWRNVMSSPSDVMAWEQMLHGIRHSGGQGNLTFPIKNPEGLVHWVEIHVSSVDTSKPFKGFEGTVRLVGAPPKSSADDSLSDRMILATSLAQVGIWEINFETKVHHWDATMFQLFDADESKVKPGYVFWNSCLHPDDRERIEWEFNMAKITDQPIEVDFRINSPKGRLKFLRAKAKIFKGENGKLVKMVGTCWDVSNAKIYETHLIKKYRLISGFIEEAPMAIAMFDADLCIVSASDMWRKLFGMPNWQLPGQKLSQLDETLSELLATAFEASTKGIESHGDRTLYTDKFGNQKWLKWRCKPWYVEQSTPGGHSVFIEDVSDQVLLKRDLHISNQAFRNNFDNAAMGMALVGPEGQWIQVNQRLCNIVGYTQDELRHLTFQDITHPEDLASDLALLKKLVQGKIQNYQLYKRYFHKQGHIVHILLGVSAVRKENGEILHFVSQIIDVSDQQRSKLLLEQELQRNERILNASTHVGIISTDKRGLISSFNRGAENLLGCSSAQVLQQKHLIEFFDPKELEDRKALHELQYAQFINPFELLILSTNKQNASAGIWTVQTKQGHSFPVQISIAPIEVDQQVTGYLVIATDFTELKSAQEKVLSLLERSNEQNDKLRGFTQMVSHNLRSHSANMEQLAQILVEDFPSIRESETYHYLHKLVGDFAHTIENLHHIALVNAFKPSEAVTVPLAPLINQVISEHRDLIEEAGMDVKLELKGKAKAKGDPSFLRYIFGQLISNAITFRDPEKQSVLIIKVNKESGGLMLEIIDNGIGFDMAKNEKKLFGLFKVFHKESKGKGLGLFLVKNMIEVMGGKIHVSSQVNKGTIFNILLENG